MTADYKQLSLFPQKAETEKETTTPADNRPPETVTWNLWHGCMAVYLYAIYIFQDISDLGCIQAVRFICPLQQDLHDIERFECTQTHLHIHVEIPSHFLIRSARVHTPLLAVPTVP